MNKMVINHLEKLFVTNDAATILRELEVSFLASEDVSCEPVFLLVGCYDLTVSKEMSLPDDLHMSLWKSLTFFTEFEVHSEEYNSFVKQH